MIIGLAGEAGVGKSTLARVIANQRGFQQYSFAQPLKEIAEVFGFPKEWLQNSKEVVYPPLGLSPRVFLQKLGTEVFREFFPQVFPELGNPWLAIARNRIANTPKLVIDDVRFEDEVEWLRELGRERNTRVVIVKVTGREGWGVSTHSSEAGIEHPDLHFLNTGAPEDILVLLDIITSNDSKNEY